MVQRMNQGQYTTYICKLLGYILQTLRGRKTFWDIQLAEKYKTQKLKLLLVG